MTLDVYRGRKATKQQQQQISFSACRDSSLASWLFYSHRHFTHSLVWFDQNDSYNIDRTVKLQCNHSSTIYPSIQPRSIHPTIHPTIHPRIIHPSINDLSVCPSVHDPYLSTCITTHRYPVFSTPGPGSLPSTIAPPDHPHHGTSKIVCAPVRSIIPSLKLGDYLSVQAHKPCSISQMYACIHPAKTQLT